MSFIDGWVTETNKRDDFLQKIEEIIDFEVIEKELAGLYTATTGRPPCSPLLMFKLSLLQFFYNLSDPEVEVQAADRLWFRRFLGLSLQERVPDETSLVRFRYRLREAELEESLFAAVNAQLEGDGFIVKRATLIDATLLRAHGGKAAPGEKPVDPDASYAKKGGAYTYGYKAHVAVDQEHILIRAVELTTAKVHDSQKARDLIPGDDSLVYADKAYDNRALHETLGARSRIMRQDRWCYKLTPKEQAFNRVAKNVRCGIERVFGYWKYWVGYTKVRYLGLRRNLTELYLRAIAYNLLRVSAIR